MWNELKRDRDTLENRPCHGPPVVGCATYYQVPVVQLCVGFRLALA